MSIDGFTLVVLKKNSSVLRNFHAWLDGASKEVIERTPALIIDDESDQASINTAKAEDDPTAINQHIRKLMTRFHVCSFVGYTATPFANVLVDALEDSDVFPRDFLISLGKPPNYFGAEELFGREKVGALKAKEGLPVIRNIPPGDSIVLSPKSVKKILDDGSSLLVPSMETAIDNFVLSCSARYVRGQHKKHMTMLLHISHLTDAQSRLKNNVDEYLKTLKFEAEKDSSELKERLKFLWEEDFAIASKEFIGAPSINFSEIWAFTKRVIEELETILENSRSLERLSFETEIPLRAIVVGGNTLSRGLTLEGLCVSYFVRTTLAYDTLLQMGRWFGFRQGYIDLTRIFVTEDLRDHFFHLATVEQEIRDEIKMMAANEERPIDVGIRIRNHPHLTVTAGNKMRRAQDCAFTYSGTKIQARHIHTQDVEIVENNYNVIKQLFDRCTKYGKRDSSVFHDFRNTLLFSRLSPEVIFQFLDEYLFSSENGKFANEHLRDYISSQNKVMEVTEWSVAFLSSSADQEVDLGGETVNVFDRSVLKRAFEDGSAKSVQLRGLSTPGEELIDLGDCIEQTVSRVEDLLPSGRERESEIALRRKYRPKERGLLLVHPLNWKQKIEEGKKFSFSEPLTASGPVFGITFVFPYAQTDLSRHGFLSNKTITGPRIVSKAEVTPEPLGPQVMPDQPVNASLPPPQAWRLSKSQYVKGRKCVKRVWLYNHRRDEAEGPTDLQQLLFRQGNEVGKLAHQFFEDGYIIAEDYRNSEAALEHTARALQDTKSKVIFEAAFIYDDVLIRVDALRKNSDGSYDLIEVKSTNSVKNEHKDDLAVQKFVLEGLGLSIKNSFLMHLNGDYVRNGEVDLKKLFVLEPMDDEIEELIDEVPIYLKLIRSKLNESFEPISAIGSVCSSPYACEFQSHCWKNVKGDSIHNLTRISDAKRVQLINLGIEKIQDIPSTFKLTDSQFVQVSATKSGKPQIEIQSIAEVVQKLEWPLHFLDYETVPFAVPRYDNSSPYQQIPFQFSLHVQREPGAALEHYSFLHRDKSDPRPAFVENLFRHVDGDKGSIVVFHMSFERHITLALADILPEYREGFEELTGRMWDLEVPFAKRWYADHRFEGSSSIKYVLPVLVPELTYKDLEIQKGDVAQMKFGEMISTESALEREKIAKALLEYCKLDTFAMVKILEKLMEICKRGTV